MFRIIKYLKKYYKSLIVIVALLVAQAVCDLSLPNYTSNIINVGVQQGGISEVAPKVIRRSELDNLLLLLHKDDQKTVSDQYKLLKKDSLSKGEYNRYKDDYPILEKEDIYILNTDDEKKIEELDTLIGKPILIASGLANDKDTSSIMNDKIDFNLPEGVNLFDVLKSSNADERDKILSSIEKVFSDMPESMISQAATSYVKAEYKTVGLDVEAIQTDYILMSGAKMICIALLSMAATVAVGFLGAKVAADLGKELRGGVYKKVLSFSSTEIKDFGTASLITRSTNDIQQIQSLIVMLIRTVFYAPILGIGAVVKVFNMNSSMAWIIAVAVGSILVIVIVMFAVAMPKFNVVQKLIDKLNLVTREILTGIPVIRAFSNQKHEEERFDEANKNLTKVTLFVNRVMSGMMPAMMLIMNVIPLLILWDGAKGIDVGTMQVGDMMAFIQYTMQIIMAFLMISMISIMLPRAIVSLKRVDEVLKKDLAITDPTSPKKFDKTKKGYVEFRNVSFRYPDASEDVITDISLVARPGQTTAFIGSTGSGKSTLINLIPRLFDVTRGELLVDGINVKEVSQHDLHDIIGYVPQSGVLFSGTIDSNIRYGNRSADQEALQKASRIAQAESFIESKEEKYMAPISQGGTNVSGGQKQRLSIARAIATNPEIYIFDDSFSALDFKTDAELRKALSKETKNATVLIVAQRISTIMHADQIIVLDDGKIVGKGTHKELLNTCEVYKEIASSQLSKEELENE